MFASDGADGQGPGGEALLTEEAFQIAHDAFQESMREVTDEAHSRADAERLAALLTARLSHHLVPLDALSSLEDLSDEMIWSSRDMDRQQKFSLCMLRDRMILDVAKRMNLAFLRVKVPYNAKKSEEDEKAGNSIWQWSPSWSSEVGLAGKRKRKLVSYVLPLVDYLMFCDKARDLWVAERDAKIESDQAHKRLNQVEQLFGRSLPAAGTRELLKTLERRVQDRDASIAWAQEDSPWGFRPERATLEIPGEWMRPADMPTAVKRECSGLADSHLFSFMQDISAHILHYTIEFIRDARMVSHMDEWRMQLERLHALKVLVDTEAETIGCAAAVCGEEVHGATKNMRGADKNQKKSAAKQKQEQLAAKLAKKRGSNPRSGGPSAAGEQDGDSSDDEDEAALQKRAEENDETLARSALAARRRQKIAEVRESAHTHLRTAEEKEALKKKREEKIKELTAKDMLDEDAAEASLLVEMAALHDLIDELTKKRPRRAIDEATLAHYKLALKALHGAMPNKKRGFPHLHLVILQMLTKSRPPDPDYLNRKIKAPLRLKCVLDKKSPRFGCLRCQLRWELGPEGELQASTQRLCIKDPDGGFCKPVMIFPCKYGSDPQNPYYKYCGCQNMYYPADYETDHDAYPPRSVELLGAYLYSLAHGGGFGWEDTRVTCTFARTRLNFVQQFLYPFKGLLCKLAQAWKAACGRVTTRNTTLWWYPKVIGEKKSVTLQTFRNFIVQLLLILRRWAKDPDLSLSRESDAWVLYTEIDRPIVQKKTEVNFFLERIIGYMDAEEGSGREKLYISFGTDAVVGCVPGMLRCVHKRFKRFCAPLGAQNAAVASQTLLHFLMGDPDWAPAVLEYSGKFRTTPEAYGALPHCIKIYECIELKDSFFLMFRSSSHWPHFVPRTQREVDEHCAHKVLYKNDELTIDLVDTFLMYMKSREPSAHSTAVPLCAHGFPDLTFEEFSSPPDEWFRCIGKYFLKPVGRWRPVTHTGRDGKQYDGKPVYEVTGHLGHDRFYDMLRALYGLLFRPIPGTRKLTPWFSGGSTGESSTGKSSVAEVWLNRFYFAEDQVAADGSFAMGDLTEYKRIVLFAEFQTDTMKLQHFKRLNDNGPMKCEGKGVKSTITENNTVACGDSNLFPSWRQDPGNQAVIERLDHYPLLVSHGQTRGMNRGFGAALLENWFKIPAFLAIHCQEKRHCLRQCEEIVRRLEIRYTTS